MIRSGRAHIARSAGCALVLVTCAVVSCAEGERAVLPSSVDAGPPVGFQACRAAFFGSYLADCTTANECTGVLECDRTRRFAEAPRCHAPLCEQDDECEEALANLCVGADFHFECLRINPLVPEECRIVEGARPAP